MPRGRRARTTGLVLVATLLPVLALGSSAAVDPAALDRGSPGIGDPYHPLDGNGGYDVAGYDLDVRYDPATDELTGTATVTAVATQRLTRFDLDLHGLTVSRVTVDDREATWSRAADELVVTPSVPLPGGRPFATVVRYSGVPDAGGDGWSASGFVHTDDGAVVSGQPESAATWFPADDHPRDAASVAVTVTAPADLVAVSNGLLAGKRTSDGWTTWRWEAAEPMAPYLVTLAIGDFDLREREVDGIRYWDAVDPDLVGGDDGGEDDDEDGGDRPLAAQAWAALDRQPEVLAFLADWFGPYPFAAAGGTVDQGPGFGGALETQTRPVYAADDFDDRDGGVGLVAHELAHQWVGDLVRLERWQDIWLNEGFATYAEWLWAEHDGRRTVQERVDDLTAESSDDDIWDVLPGDPGADDLFSDAVYERGALTLHALREEVGDAAFRRVLRTWTSTMAGQAVTTADFVAVAEQVSGRQLDRLFRTWLYTAGRPAALR
jgi:aminopeptidase N